MLSLEHAASGTNLTEATHIVLMDPVAGTQAEAVSIEQQAIGRAHRMGQNKQVSLISKQVNCASLITEQVRLCS